MGGSCEAVAERQDRLRLPVLGGAQRGLTAPGDPTVAYTNTIVFEVPSVTCRRPYFVPPPKSPSMSAGSLKDG